MSRIRLLEQGSCRYWGGRGSSPVVVHVGFVPQLFLPSAGLVR